ncbi:MAG TPA: hypothetical protein VGM88_28420 [Kofleriaceae bacterium]|jgi:hypothetical protein
MYRYGDGTPFPLDENFIETLTLAVESCTNAFDPVTELDARREKAKEMRREGDKELTRLADLEAACAGALVSWLPGDGKKPGLTQQVATKINASVKQAVGDARKQVESRVVATETQAAPRTASDAILAAMRPFFDAAQLPNTVWIMSWDVRGAEAQADAVATAGRIVASFSLSPEPYKTQIRVETVAEGVVVHMMKKGVFGKAKPAPIDLAKYVIVAYEKTVAEQVVTLKESGTKASPGLRFAVTEGGATWVAITAAGDTDGEANPLETEDVAPIRALADRTGSALKDLVLRRTLVQLTLNGTGLADLDEPRIIPLEVLSQLAPLARTLRERSRASGELVLKRDIGDGRREELFVPRSTLAQQFAHLPAEYRKPFEEMGITGEETSPAIHLPPRTPAQAKTIKIDVD